jgi:hypothetical protein
MIRRMMREQISMGLHFRRIVGLWSCATNLWLLPLLAPAGPSPASASPDQDPTRRVPEVICLGEGASDLEWLAAQEVRRYVYLRTAKLMRLRTGPSKDDRIVVGSQDRSVCADIGQDLAPQQFTLKTGVAGGKQVWWIVGGDALGTLYGAYRFAEKLGVRFGPDEDVLPDERWSGGLPLAEETGKPRFALRGLQPFHDFSVGPDWWNGQDYQGLLSQMAKLRMNFLGLHTYPSWNPSAGPEANVWIGLPEDVDERGNVRLGYEAGVVTTRRGWEVKPFPTSRYASGAGLLFESDEYGPDFMLDCLDWPKTAEAGASMFNRYGDFQQHVFQQAHRLGVKTCVGPELPLGIPPMLAARLKAKGMKPDDPAVIRRLYEGTFLRLMRKLPVDYVWLWAPEIWLGAEPGCAGWEITTRANVERDLRLIQEAAREVRAPFEFGTCGWRLGTRDDPFWFDKHTPKSWAASAINTSGGADPVEKHYGAMTGRPKWVIGWAEDDSTAGAHCCTCWDLQLWVERMFVNSQDAARYGCEGMMAIHWRTASVSPNLMALARAGWDFAGGGGSTASPAAGTNQWPGMDDYWAEWGRGMFGGEAGAEVGRSLQKFDGSHPAINGLVGAGAQTTDAKIAGLFAPLRDMEALRPRIQGAGNLERLDYWVNLIRASELRVRTWVSADRLAARVKEASGLADADQRVRLARTELLPRRLELARSYEALMAALVRCAKSPGEVGTIASIESGMRARVVSGQDEAIAKLLGTPLPAEAALSTAYHGPARIFVSAKCTQMTAHEPQEIRAFVLSESKCQGLNLYWRRMGEGSFKRVPGSHRARQAFRVTLPGTRRATLEYYLEAVLDDGRKALWPASAPAIAQTVVAW